MSIIDKLSAKTSGIQARAIEKPTEKPAKSAPVMMYDATARMHAAEQKVEELEAELRTKQAQTGYLDIPLDQLHKVPGRQRTLTPEERAELKQNLRQHPLASPITVEIRPEGGFNIVAGNNRVDLYRELNEEHHDKPTIKACLIDEEPAVTEELAFYANLLHPSLPAFEKFVGLKRIMEKDPSKPMTHQELADRTGITRSTVTDLLKFDELPSGALELLRSKPSALGSKAAASLAALTTKGRGNQVVEAVRKLVNENLTEADAIKIASEDKPATQGNTESETIKAGRSTFCTVRGVKKTLRVDFQTEADRLEVEALVKKLLQDQADRRKQAGK